MPIPFETLIPYGIIFAVSPPADDDDTPGSGPKLQS